MELKKFYIRERWIMGADEERYDEKDTPSNTVYGEKAVKKWIENWIETWEENAEDSGYRFVGSKTNHKTYANLRIDVGREGNHSFRLRVVEAKN